MNYLKNKINHKETPFQLLSLTILVKLLVELLNGRYLVHKGELVGRQFFSEVFIVHYYGLEAFAIASLSLFIFFNFNRNTALKLLPFMYFSSLAQYYSNHKFLIFLVLIIFNFPKAIRNQCLKIQLVIVYYFTVINKVVDGFYNGETLSNTFFNFHHHELSYSFMNGLYATLATNDVLNICFANITLFLEIVIPIFLFKKSYWGLGLMLILHLSFSLLISGILPFMLIMFTMALAFYSETSELTEQ